MNPWIVLLGWLAAAAPWIQEREALVLAFERAQEVSGLELDQLAVEAAPGKPPTLAVLVGSSETQRHVSLLVRDQDSGAYGAALSFQLELHGRYWMRPDRPRFADLDGDGQAEVLLGFSCLLADRTTRTAVVLARRSGGWTILTPPALLATVRSHAEERGQRMSIFQDDKLQQLVVSGGRTMLHGLHSGGGWRVVERPHGGGSGLLGVGVTAGDGRLTGDHDLVLALYRLTADGYVLDSDWNGGELLVTVGRVPIEAAVAQNWGR